MPLYPQGGGLYPNSIDNVLLADMAAGTFKGRPLGAGIGDPQDLTLESLGLPRLLATLVATNSASLDFTQFDPTKYNSYRVHGTGLSPSVDAALRLVASVNGGASYDLSASYVYMSDTLGSSEGALSVGTTGAVTFYQLSSVIKGANAGINFIMDIQINGPTTFQTQAMEYDSDNRWRQVRNSGVYGATGCNAFRIYPSAGLISSGIACVYGYPK